MNSVIFVYIFRFLQLYQNNIDWFKVNQQLKIIIAKIARGVSQPVMSSNSCPMVLFPSNSNLVISFVVGPSHPVKIFSISYWPPPDLQTVWYALLPARYSGLIQGKQEWRPLSFAMLSCHSHLHIQIFLFLHFYTV